MIAGLIFLGAVLASCFLSSVIMYLEYVNRLKPNSAIKLNFYNKSHTNPCPITPRNRGTME